MEKSVFTTNNISVFLINVCIDLCIENTVFPFMFIASATRHPSWVGLRV